MTGNPICWPKRSLAALGVCLVVAVSALSVRAPFAADSESMETARRLVVVSNMEATAAQAMDLMEEPLLNILTHSNPSEGAIVAQIVREHLLPEMKSRVSELTDAMAEVYARHFSNDEIRQLVAFYESPIGRRLVEEQPALMAEAAQIGNELGQRIAIETLQKLGPLFRERGLEVPPI